jgi:hypothetical protein
LLDQLLRGGTRGLTSTRALEPGGRPSPLRDRRSVDALGEAYLRGAKAREQRASDAGALPLPAVEIELLRFAGALARTRSRVRSIRPERGTIARGVSRARAVQALAKVAADFVTPGDLLQSPSLATIGRLDLGATG